MSFPRYPEYKPSGVAWLGEVPGHWDVAALGFRYQVDLGKMLDSKRITGEFLRPYLRNSDVQWGSIRTDDLPMMDFEPDERERYGLREGDILVCEGGEVGRCAIWQGKLPECYYQKALHRVRPWQAHRDAPAFLAWCLHAAGTSGVFTADEAKATIAHLPAESFRRYRFSFPPIDEQHAIAAFLDRETARIDALVAEQERLIELLREKRQAVISHAVTKGLDPTVPMKDSGVEWLGEVPAHWEVLPMKRLISSVDQGDSPQCLSEPAAEGEWGVLKVGCVNGGRFAANEQKALPANHPFDPRAEVREGDLVMSRGNTLDLVGSVAYVTGVRSRLLLSDLLYRFRTVPPNNARCLAYWLGSSLGRFQIERDAVGTSASMKKVSKEVLSSLDVICLPPDEQESIATYLDTETARIDTLITEAQHAITLLQERRAALISAAVTGQIDVRELS